MHVKHSKGKTRWKCFHLLQMHGRSELPVPLSVTSDVIMTSLLLLRTVNVLANFIIISNTFLFKVLLRQKMLFSISLDSDFIFGKNAPCQSLRLDFKNKHFF